MVPYDIAFLVGPFLQSDRIFSSNAYSRVHCGTTVPYVDVTVEYSVAPFSHVYANCVSIMSLTSLALNALPK